MGLRDKVALVYAVTLIIFISHVACMPKTKKNFKVLNKCNSQAHNRESIYKKYKFPETEYATSFKPSTTHNFDAFDSTYSLNKPSQRSQNLLKQTRSKKQRKLFNNNRRKVENAIDILPTYGDLPHFPEVEYPLHARDIWKPIYWNDLIPSIDNGQSNIFKPATKPCKKIKKNEFEIKNCFKGKAAPDKSKVLFKVQNNTDDEICSKNMTTIMMTTSAPFSNNFLMKDKDSFPVLTNDEKEKTYIATKPISRNICTLNTDQSDYQQTNKSIINNARNTTSVTDFCSDDRKNTSILQPIDNFGYKEMEKDIGIDEEFTTDEPDFAFALSTPQPPNTEDMLWKESKVIEPFKPLYPDELDDYFIAVQN